MEPSEIPPKPIPTESEEVPTHNSVETVPDIEPAVRRPVTLAEFRRDAGLPEHSPLLEEAPAHSLIVEDYISQKRISRIECHREHQAQYSHSKRPEYPTKRKLDLRSQVDRAKESIAQARTVSALRRAGVTAPEELVEFVAEQSTHGSLDLRFQLDRLRKAVKQPAIVEAINRLSPDMLSTVSRRLAAAPFVFNHGYSHLALWQAIENLAASNEQIFLNTLETFNQFQEEFHYEQRLCVYELGEDNQWQISPDFIAFTETIAAGGLSDEEKGRIRQAQRFIALTDNTPIVQKGEAYSSSNPRFCKVITSELDYELAEQMLETLENIAWYRLSRNPEYWRDKSIFPRVSIDTLLRLAKMEMIPRIHALSGISGLVSVHNILDRIVIKDDELADMVGDINKEYALLTDRDRLEWSTAFAELRHDHVIEPDKIEKYTGLYAIRDDLITLQEVITMLNEAIGTERFELMDYVSPSITASGTQVRIDWARVYKDISEHNYRIQPGTDNPARRFIRLVSKYLSRLNKEHPEEVVPLLGYLFQEKDHLDTLFDADGLASASLIESVLLAQIYPREVIEALTLECKEIEQISPALAWQNISLFNTSTALRIISEFTDDFVTTLPREGQALIQFLRDDKYNRGLSSLIIELRDQLDKYYVNGLPTYSFIELALSQGRVTEVQGILDDELLATFTTEQRTFWRFARSQTSDYFAFLASKPITTFLRPDGTVDTVAARNSFVDETIATPEKCTTYELLAELFDKLASEHLPEEALSRALVRIAEAHRVAKLNISARTEVERTEELKRSFSSLYNPNMPQSAKLAWRILQRHLPFSANESYREQMRQQALVVERLNSGLLTWAHESVHNYASTFEVAYLQNFYNLLLAERLFREAAGDDKEKPPSQELIDTRAAFDEIRSRFSGEPRAPSYTAEDMDKLLAIPELLPELSRLIELTRQFYEIQPGTLEKAISDTRTLIQDSKVTALLARLQDDVTVLSADLLPTDARRASASADFIKNVNAVRTRILFQSGSAQAQQKAALLTLDSVLEHFSQAIFTKQREALQATSGSLSTDWLLTLDTLTIESLRSAYLNGEVDEDPYYEGFTDTTKTAIHAAALQIPIISFNMEQYWKQFGKITVPEMMRMLSRQGFSAESALERILWTDLVEFRKMSMAYVIEPILELAKEAFGKAEQALGSESGAISRQLSQRPTVEGEAPAQPAVIKHVEDKIRALPPAGASAAELSTFFSRLEALPEYAADIIAKSQVPGYMDEKKLVRKYRALTLNSHKVEIYPISAYGMDFAVIMVDGKIVEDSKQFLVEMYRPPKAALGYIRPGD